MEPMDRDRLLELMEERNDADPSLAPTELLEGEALAAYKQGRIDEYASQNAVDDHDLRHLEVEAREQ